MSTNRKCQASVLERTPPFFTTDAKLNAEPLSKQSGALGNEEWQGDLQNRERPEKEFDSGAPDLSTSARPEDINKINSDFFTTGKGAANSTMDIGTIKRGAKVTTSDVAKAQKDYWPNRTTNYALGNRHPGLKA